MRVRVPRWVIGASFLAGFAAVRSRNRSGLRRPVEPDESASRARKSPAGEKPVGEQPLEIEIPEGADGAIHLMMSDGSVVEASEELDPDGRLRYLADNLLGPGHTQN